MRGPKTFTHALVVVLAVAAVAAPSALARPGDNQPAPQRSTPFEPESPLSWGFEYDPDRPYDRPATTGDDTPWAIVGFTITGSVLLLGGIAIASRSVVHARRATSRRGVGSASPPAAARTR